ncbi:MAG TPA: protein translocase subunit SecF [Spirochaetales bacterium]|nr:protein translocase subunit SecF [Spirochaetales bacterium]HQK34671.1 protein translocase subunit SecF [Spirochaetales bacterium]
MKHIYKFHTAFLPAVIVALIFIAFSVVGLVTMGLNMGVDFKAGINQTVLLAYPAGELTFAGDKRPSFEITQNAFTLVFSGAEVENRTLVYELAKIGTLGNLAQELAKEGVTFTFAEGAESLSATLLVPTYQTSPDLGTDPVVVYRFPQTEAERFGAIEEVRKAANSVGSANVQQVQNTRANQYMIRISDPGNDSNFAQNTTRKLLAAFEAQFGKNRVVFMKTDYIGARFSADLGRSSWILVLASLAVIMIYASIRFKFQYASGAILALVHDAFIMLGFMVWTRMEFNTISIAAILTILGYSINDTIIIFDRVREDHKLFPTDSLQTIFDRSISETLGRTIITSITTLLAVLALYFGTSGSIKDFAAAVTVGIISGTYSTIFIACSFVLFEQHIRDRKNKNTVSKAAKA